MITGAAPSGIKQITTKYRVTITHDTKAINATEYDRAIIAHGDYENLVKIENDYRRAYLSTHDGRNSDPTGVYVRITLEKITTETDGPLTSEKQQVISHYVLHDSPTEYEQSVDAAVMKTRAGGTN
ncbi:MAG: hypothetical protein ACRYFS_24435 [Janthinobacterium lividum]